MTRGRRIGAAGALGLLAAGVGAGAAQGAYGPGAEPASATPRDLGAGESFQAMLSADGNRVVFRTSAANLLDAAAGGPPAPGTRRTVGLIWRDLASGRLELVAPPGTVGPDSEVVIPAPSSAAALSRDGCAVSFSTSLGLAAGDANGSDDVYVRRMCDPARPVDDAGSYELVSARDGGDTPPRYSGPGGGAGSTAGPDAISDDGRRVAFVTRRASDLLPGGALTPRDQVLVRDLDRRETRLVSRATLTGGPVPDVPDLATDPPLLSGDGSAVAWAGESVAAQTPTLPGEYVPPRQLLWRDLTAPADAPARRVSGAVDPEDPACVPGTPVTTSPSATGPCFGPLAAPESSQPDGPRPSFDIGTPGTSMSDDGSLVAFRSSANLRPLAPGGNEQRTNEQFVATMRPAGVTRKQGLRRVLSYPAGAPEAVDGIRESRLSGDGRVLGVVTKSRAFPDLRPVGTFPTTSADWTNVYAIDLASASVQRVTRNFDPARFDGLEDYLAPQFGSDAGVDPEPRSLSLSADGSVASFSARDGNLFADDANGRLDVHVVRPSVPPAPPTGAAAAAAPGLNVGPPLLGPPPVSAPTPFAAVIGNVRLARDGVATIVVRVPRAGRLTATAASGRLRVARTVRAARGAATVRLRLTPTRAARRRLDRRPHRLAVTARIAYVPAATGTTPTRAIRRYRIVGRRAVAQRRRAAARRAAAQRAARTPARRTR